MSTMTRAQGEWEMLIPSCTPTSNQLVSLDFIDENTGWAVGDCGTIVKTNDGGLSWRILDYAFPGVEFTDVNFPTALLGYAVGKHGYIIKTTNGGETWTKQSIRGEDIHGNDLYRVRFKDKNTGWIIGEKGLILFTDDGGSRWTKQESNTAQNLYAIDFLGSSDICVAGANNVILITTNNGQIWQEKPYSNPAEKAFTYLDVYFRNENRGWIGGYYFTEDNGNEYKQGVLLKTSDAGNTWNREAYSSDVSYDSDWSYDEHETGEYTTPLDYLPPLQQIYFNDNQTDGLCLTDRQNTSRYGESYSLQYASLPFYVSEKGKRGHVFIRGLGDMTNERGRFHHLSDKKIICTGYGGDFRFSEDGGKSWYPLNDKDRWWEQFFVGSNGELMYFQRDMDDTNLKNKNKYLFYFSNDYGSSWQFFKPKVYNKRGKLISAYTFSTFLKIYQIKDILITCDFEISAKRASYISTDLGRTWRETDFHHYSMIENMVNLFHDLNAKPPVGGSLPFIVKFFDIDTLFVYGLARVEQLDDYENHFVFSRSFDGGLTHNTKIFKGLWNDIWLSPYDSINVEYIFGSYFLNSRTGFIVGSGGNILRTDNSGQNWVSIQSGVVDNLRGITFINNRIGLICGEFGRILKSTDSGLTWRKTNSATANSIYCINFRNEKEGWTGHDYGLLHTTDGGESWMSVSSRYYHGRISHIDFDNQGNAYAYTLMHSYGNINYHANSWRPKDTLAKKKFSDTNVKCYSNNYIYLLRLGDCITDVQSFDGKKNQPEQFSLSQNYPNPFNTATRIRYELPEEAKVTLRIFNMLGQTVRTLAVQKQKAGLNKITWHGRDDAGNEVPSGVYVYRIQVNGVVLGKRKMVVLR